MLQTNDDAQRHNANKRRTEISVVIERGVARTINTYGNITVDSSESRERHE